MVVVFDATLDRYFQTCKPTNKTLIEIPTIELNSHDAKTLIVMACQEFGFFKVVKHDIPLQIMTKLEEETAKFFEMPQFAKERAGIPNPFGYGNKKIGRNGDVGWVEYLLLTASPEFISQICSSVFPDNPEVFSKAIKNYVTRVKKMAIQVLELIAEGLEIEDKHAFSNLIKDQNSDCLFRLNHYPACPELGFGSTLSGKSLVGFGEHTDPQIISVLRSNNTSGLQICLRDGTWVSVPSDQTSFFINVGDLFQVMTNGRFKSVKHRVLPDHMKSRISMIFFGGPPPNETISPLPSIMQYGEECLYQEFTWSDYKKAAFRSRLSDNRLEGFAKKKSSCKIHK